MLGFFLGEAAVLAAVGAALGAPAGWLLARAAVRLTSSTVNTLYVTSQATVPALGVTDLLIAGAVAIPLALIAAVIPAAESVRITPIDAVRDMVRGDDRRPFPWRAALLAAALFAAAGWLATLDAVGGLPVFGLCAALAVLFGAAAMVPPLLDLLRRQGRPLLARWFRVEGLLAHANLAAAALAAGRLRGRPWSSVWRCWRRSPSWSAASGTRWPTGSDRRCRPTSSSPPPTAGRLAPAVWPASRKRQSGAWPSHAAVVAVDAFRTVDLPYGPDGDLILLGAGRFDVMTAHGGLLFKDPADGRAALREAIGADAVVVSESFAIKYGAAVGDQIELDTPRGARPFHVGAVYYDYSSDRGLVVMDVATFARHYRAQRPSGLTLYLAPGSDPDVVRDELLAAAGPHHQLLISTNAALRAVVLRIFDATFAITYALEAIAIVVAIMGVIATLLTLALERRRELAMLRLVGAGRRQIRRMVVIEAALIGLVSQGAGLAVGVALSLILIYVINVQSFGWTIQFHLPLGFLAQATLLIAVTTALAGLYPARIAARVVAGG